MVRCSPQMVDQHLGVLIVTQGQWAERIADNIGRFHPFAWTVERWSAPRRIPPVVDEPTEYLPQPGPLLISFSPWARRLALLSSSRRLRG